MNLLKYLPLPPPSAEHPFRLFFPLTCVGAWLALLPWWTLLLFPAQAGFFPLHWHAFAFINLCSGAAFAGFLLTALPAWTQWRFPLTLHTHLLLLFWLTELFALPVPRLAMFAANVFWLYLGGLALFYIIYTRSSKLLGFVPMLAALMALSIAYSINPTGKILHETVDVMLMAVALVNFRVGRVIGNDALSDAGYPELSFIPNPYTKNISVCALGLYVVCNVSGAEPIVLGWLALAVSCAFAARLQDWHSLKLLHAHYVRAHYSVSLALTLGYAGVAAGLLLAPVWYSPARHFLAITAMLTMITVILSIAGLRHSGVRMWFYPDTRLAIILLLLAGISRSGGALFLPSVFSIYALPSVCIGIAFLLYAVRYISIFRRTRPR